MSKYGVKIKIELGRMSFDLAHCIYVSVNYLLIYQAFEYVNIFKVFRKFLKRRLWNCRFVEIEINYEQWAAILHVCVMSK